jgi:hypothetical protein
MILGFQLAGGLGIENGFDNGQLPACYKLSIVPVGIQEVVN